MTDSRSIVGEKQGEEGKAGHEAENKVVGEKSLGQAQYGFTDVCMTSSKEQISYFKLQLVEYQLCLTNCQKKAGERYIPNRQFFEELCQQAYHVEPAVWGPQVR